MISFRSTRSVFVAILALGLFALATRNVADPDLWWHLQTGQLILQTGRVPHADPYSFTRFGQSWIDHEWLSQILLYLCYRAWRFSGLIALFGVVISVTQFLIYARCSGRPYAAGVLTLWSAWTSWPAWGARPQMFSLLLAAVFLLLLERCEEHKNLLWCTVPLMLLWANLHAGYILGLVLIALFLVGKVMDYALGCESWLQAGPQMRHLAVVLAACLAAVPLNPNGLRLLRYPFDTFTSPTMQRYIVEWASPDFHRWSYAPLLALLLAVLAGLALSRKSMRPGQMLLLVATAAGALHSIRNIPIFALVAVPLLSELAGSCSPLQGLTSRIPKAGGYRKPVFNFIAFAGLGVFVGVWVGKVIHQQPEIEASKYPAAAVAFLSAHDVPAPLFNSYDWGGYLIWRLYPDQRVLVDGRADVYGDQFLEDYASTYEVKDNWKAVLERWHIQSVVIPAQSALALALKQTGEWDSAYADEQAVVLERRDRKGGGEGSRRVRQDPDDTLPKMALRGAIPAKPPRPARVQNHARNCNQIATRKVMMGSVPESVSLLP